MREGEAKVVVRWGGGGGGGCDRNERARQTDKRRGGNGQREMKAGETRVLGVVQRSNARVCCQINTSCRRTSCHVKSLPSPSPSVSAVLLHAPLHTHPTALELDLRVQAAPSFQRQRRGFKRQVAPVMLSIKYNSGMIYIKIKALGKV